MLTTRQLAKAFAVSSPVAHVWLPASFQLHFGLSCSAATDNGPSPASSFLSSLFTFPSYSHLHFGHHFKALPMRSFSPAPSSRILFSYFPLWSAASASSNTRGTPCFFLPLLLSTFDQSHHSFCRHIDRSLDPSLSLSPSSVPPQQNNC